jgi:putative hydrolase of the HAD superfamily
VTILVINVDNSTIQLVCFDLGRVLIRICDNWKHACERAGITVPTREIDNAAIMDVVIRNETGRLDHAGFCREAAPIFGLTESQVDALSIAYLIEPYPGVAKLLQDLRQAGVKTACLSNTNPTHWSMMCDATHHCGLPFDLLDYRFASQEIGHRKPDEAIYAYVEEATGIAGHRIAFFDDMPANVEAARQRQWQAFVVVHDGDPVTQARRHLQALSVLSA